uniref:J domain-containing protein n=1 Tax=Aegilops tauschii subsp. strangulata TaxID=200361 RepID=A0A453T4U7_AEGTS
RTHFFTLRESFLCFPEGRRIVTLAATERIWTPRCPLSPYRRVFVCTETCEQWQREKQRRACPNVPLLPASPNQRQPPPPPYRFHAPLRGSLIHSSETPRGQHNKRIQIRAPRACTVRTRPELQIDLAITFLATRARTSMAVAAGGGVVLSLRGPSSSAWPAVGRRRRASSSAAVRCGATREKRPAATPGVALEEDHYRTLRLAPGATRGEVKKAFHRLALQYHPDVVRQENSDRVDFQRINAARTGGVFFFEMEEDPRPLHLEDACSHFINYSHKTLQSHTTVRLKPPTRQQKCRYSYPTDEGMLIVWA